MKSEQLREQFGELAEQISSFFRRDGTQAQVQRAFDRHRQEMLAKIPDMGDILKDYPCYGAVGLLGKFQFVDGCEDVTCLLAEETTHDLLCRIKERKAVRVAQSAKPAWDFLSEKDPEVLCTILALCYLASKDREISKVCQA